MAVSLRLGHVQLLDEDPFRPVHQTDLLHFFLHRGGLLFQLPQPFPGGYHPLQALLKGLGGNGLCQGKNALGNNLFVDLLKHLRPNQQQGHGSGPAGGIDGEPGPHVIRQRGIDDYDIKGPAHHLPAGSRRIPHEGHRVILRPREHLREDLIEFLCRRNHKHAVGLFTKDHTCPLLSALV